MAMLEKLVKKLILLLCLLVVYMVYSVNAAPVSQAAQNKPQGVSPDIIKSTAPENYTVKNSDTVIKLAKMYLNKISYWAQFLGIKNTLQTKIYPGDKLHILTLDGMKVLGIVSGQLGPVKAYDKIIPTVHTISNNGIPIIPLKKLDNLILQPMLVTEASFKALPIVISGAEPGASMYTTGDTVYVKGLTHQQAGDQVAIFSEFRCLIDPDTQESLGCEIRYNGNAVIDQLGPISSLRIISLVNPIVPLDRVLVVSKETLPELIPHKPQMVITGKIIALYDALTTTAQDSTVVINRGSRDGVEAGQLYDITDTRKLLDPTSSPNQTLYLIMPPKIIGEILIYKVYEKASFGLITSSAAPILLNSVIQSQR